MNLPFILFEKYSNTDAVTELKMGSRFNSREAQKPIVATDNLIWILFEAVKNYE